MIELALLLQVVVACTILNVWLIRATKETAFRGASARSLREEFVQYGLSDKVYWATSILKPMLAVSLLVALFYPFLTKPAAFALSIFMIGAIVMHLKVKDSIKKFIPATLLLSACIAILVLS